MAKTTLVTFAVLLLLSFLPAVLGFIHGRDGFDHPFLKQHYRFNILQEPEHDGIRGIHNYLTKKPQAKNVPLKVNIDNHHLTLLLEVNHGLFHPAAKHLQEKTDTVFVKGTVEGYERSSVRMAFYDHMIMEGLIRFSNDNGIDEIITVEAMRNSGLKKGMHPTKEHHFNFKKTPTEEWRIIAYRAEDDISLEVEEHKNFCGTQETLPIKKGIVVQNLDGSSQIDPEIQKRIDAANSEMFEKLNSAKRNFIAETNGVNITDGVKTQCGIALLSDYVFYEKYEIYSRDHMIALFNEVQDNFLEQLGIELPIVVAAPIIYPNDPSGLGTPPQNVDDFFYLLGNNTLNGRWPIQLTQVSSFVCAIHVLSRVDFKSTVTGMKRLGYSWTGIKEVGVHRGVCSPTAHNIGFTTTISNARELTRFAIQKVIVHGLGHNFGSQHDDDYVNNPAYTFDFDKSQCLPSNPTNLYVMKSDIHVGKNAIKFSPCSVADMVEKAPLLGTCFMKPGDFTGEFAVSDPRILPYLQHVDECRNPPIALPPTTNNVGWFACDIPGSGAVECTLSCSSPGADNLCQTFQNGARGVVNKKDGYPCGNRYPITQVCRGGLCTDEWRVRTCDRTQPCCSIYGDLKDSNEYCIPASPFQNTNPCRPPKNFCDPQDLFSPTGCSFTVQKPGVNCGNCEDIYDPSTCDNTKVCGSGASFGMCVDNVEVNPAGSVQANNADLCNGFKCQDGIEQCVVLGNNPVCVQIVNATCKHFCDNSDFKYAYQRPGEEPVAWDCDCRRSCQSRNACCRDYSNYCLNDPSLYKPRDVPKSLIPYSTRPVRQFIQRITVSLPSTDPTTDAVLTAIGAILIIAGLGLLFSAFRIKTTTAAPQGYDLKPYPPPMMQ